MSFDSPAYILWLPSWYPNKLAPYDGDFIQRHAQAASAFIPIHVLYLVKDKEKMITNSVYVEEKRTGNLFETIIYYANRNFLPAPLGKVFGVKKFTTLYKKFVSDLFEKKGLPTVVHVHIAFKAGVIATWIKKTYGIPFLLNEHWTIYLEEAKPNFAGLNFFKRHFISKAITEASKVFSVSNYLGTAIKKRWPFIDCGVIPNVVNTDIFHPGGKTTNQVYRLVHISSLNYQKDPETLFKAIKILKDFGVRFRIDVFGASANFITSFVDPYGVKDLINFHEEVPQQILAEHLRQADLLVLYSRYETFGCVIIEANACGVPVVVSDIPVMRELIRDNENGVLVRPRSAVALAETILGILNNKDQFNREEIAESADKYSYSRIGKMFLDEYSPFFRASSSFRP